MATPPTTTYPYSSTSHPLDELSGEEISSISLAVRQHGATNGLVKACKFITASLVPPPKEQVLAFLGIPIAPGQAPPPAPESIPRRGEIDFIDVVTGAAYNAVLTKDVATSTWAVDSFDKLAEGVQPQITPEELLEAEEIVRKDPTVIKLAAAVGVSPEQLCADGWSIGYDARFPTSKRLQQCLLYARFSPDSNLYSHPMDFFPVIEDTTKSVIHIDFAPHYTGAKGELSGDGETKPPALDEPDYALKRERIAPPTEPHEYLPELMATTSLHSSAEEAPAYKAGLEAREGLKPLHITQPQGVSFTMNGNELAWQKWRMHIGFNGREGLVISTVTYDDELTGSAGKAERRGVMYRMSLAEMVVPYGAPEHPHGRKFAFDVGEYGMGAMANDLTLGCDCLGTIHYLPGCFVSHNGQPTVLNRAVCIHEEDAGLLWKHTDFRAGGKAISVRSRKLVVSFIATVANYEYCFYYNFFQDGTIELETRLTGILNVYAAAQGEHPPHGTLVAPQIQAHYHQHIFSLRLDTMVDGLNNSVIESDILPMEQGTGSKENFAGNGFVVQKQVLKDGAREYNAELDRRWTIVNPGRTHYASGNPVGFNIAMKGAATRLLAKPDSWIARRATFATKTLWVVKDEEGKRMFPAGKYVPQTRDSPADSIGEWVKSDKSIENEDLLLFLTFGTTHIPRPEDWPVMPVEHLRVTLKPNNFFKWSPALDVKAEEDSHSALAFGTGAVPPVAPPANPASTGGAAAESCGCH
ncbi:hypothetical protein DL93DRAFT_2058917 [Clavulina sp. PMI_390]|nr:hypothetical protein DL93DRAFT_2058917 [Clavulina sp. PMI_390]